MAFLKDLPLQRKLSLIVLVAIFTALASSIAVLLVYYNGQARNNLIQELQALSSLTAQRSDAALMFRDKNAILENLQALTSKRSIESLCVYDDKKSLFAGVDVVHPEKPRCENQMADPPGVTFVEDQLRLVTAIEVRGRAAGSLLMVSNINPIKSNLLQFFLVLFFAALMSIGLAYLVTLKLTALVSKPITQLTKLTEKIRTSDDYSLRAQYAGKDETGELVKNFNDMVSKIQTANSQMDQLLVELRERSAINEAHADKMSKRHDAIREFFSGVTHDLRQPLQAIDMYVSVLQGSQDEAQRRDLYRKLHLAVSNLGSMFRELLDVSRFEAKLEKVEERETVDVAAVLEPLSIEFEALAAEKGLRFRSRIRSCKVSSNGTLLVRVIRNLVSNAIRYTDRGGVLVAVRIRKKQIWIDVWDTGRGIPENKQDEIFKQFSQVRSQDAQQGHGLGLSIVKRLMEALGHQLELKSIDGQGTLFRMHLPKYLEPDTTFDISTNPVVANNAGGIENPANPLPVMQQPISVSSVHTGALIYIIDDDPLVLDALRQLIESWQMRVKAFSGVEEVNRWLSDKQLSDEPLSDNLIIPDEEKPSLVISDFHLSNEQLGTDVLPEIVSRLHGVPAFIISSTTNAEDIKTIKAAGYKLLSKPVRPAKLRALINYYITENQS